MSYMLEYPTWVLFMVAIHVSASVGAIITGIIPMRAKKGGKLHNRAGRVYFWLMMLTCVSASILLIHRFTTFLAMITVLSAYSAIIGYRVLRRKRGEKPQWIDWGSTIFAGVAAVIFLLWGIITVINGLPNVSIFGVLGIGFGLLLISQVRPDLRAYLNPPTEPRWWMYYHMDNMLSSYVALMTAFMVQITTRTVPISIGWIAWVAPGVIGGILISRWIRATKARFEQPTTIPKGN